MSAPMVRIPFEGLYNFRDLGGYACPGGVTAFGRVFRCDNLHDLSINDQKKLEKIGIKTVIDLRTNFELERRPNAFAGGAGGVEYHHLSLLEPVMDFGAMQKNPPQKEFDVDDMKQLYLGMLEKSQPVFKEILTVIARHIDQPLAFHCSEGKDRTGLTAMLLLGICGVAEEDIITNYQISRTYIALKYVRDERYKGGNAIDTPPHLMEAVLETLEKGYGGVLGYVRQIGITEEQIKAIKGRMIALVEE